MKILSIETSCDETAVSIVEGNGGLEKPFFRVLGNAIYSQIELHKEYGGVYPNLAKREHAKKLTPLLEKVLRESFSTIDPAVNSSDSLQENKIEEISKILDRENGLKQNFLIFAKKYPKNPGVDVIAVTSGPGLEPALWVGINFARALGKLWDLPVRPTNHMEGHIASVLLKTNASDDSEQSPVEFPAIALLISGGHTELVEISEWGKYKILGATKDDAVGEAFDKVARMLGLPYPGGPQISMLAEDARKNGLQKKCQLPRPMIHSGDFDFSFSGLKTAVLYYIKKLPELTDEDKKDIAREFEDAVVDVLSIKTASVLGTTPAKTLILAGGVIANKMIRQKFENFSQKYPGLSVWFPTNSLSTDNSVMIAAAAYIGEMLGRNHTDELEIRAKGNLSIEE